MSETTKRDMTWGELAVVVTVVSVVSVFWVIPLMIGYW